MKSFCSIFISLTSYKFNAYREAGVREYWMVIPQEGKVIACRFEAGNEATYRLDETVPVGIYEDFAIDFAEVAAEVGEVDMDARF